MPVHAWLSDLEHRPDDPILEAELLVEEARLVEMINCMGGVVSYFMLELLDGNIYSDLGDLLNSFGILGNHRLLLCKFLENMQHQAIGVSRPSFISVELLGELSSNRHFLALQE